ncbi:hypothetical protein DFO67_10464 [Modicisalibacter xianhensis]|uniref:Uncharacterized protein n=1 Tax=Modicisalibacter xianhensis TaxID=442341 RepID=A0A4R8G6A5_9GAMM|nr:hypothetical protein [Halomonas xianhensis]TDX30809.1 hypothetical protein DFO67_10464 [Halomonas xianhensis]
MTDIEVTREEDEAFEQLARRNDELEREKAALLEEIDRLQSGQAA